MVAIISRATWGALPANRPIQTIATSRRTGFVVHHSVSGTGANPTGARALIRSFQRLHQSNGWGDIGYNFLIDAWGNVYQGRGLNAIGAHAGGHNANNLGVCYIGDGRTGEMPDAAKQAFRNLYAWLNAQTGKTLTRLVHSDLNSTACPGPFIRDWVKAGGLVAGAIAPASTTTKEDDMTPDQANKLDAIYAALFGPKNLANGPDQMNWINSPAGDPQRAYYGVLPITIHTQTLIANLAAQVAKLATIDAAKVAAAVAALSPAADVAKITAAVEAALADDFARVNANVDQIPLGFTVTAK